MTYDELEAILKPTGIPWTYHHWDKAPAPPYGVYLSYADDPFFADDRTFFRAGQLRLEIYSLERDTALDDAVRSVLDAADIPYDTDYTWIEDQELYETIFEIEV